MEDVETLRMRQRREQAAASGMGWLAWDKNRLAAVPDLPIPQIAGKRRP